MVSAPSVQDAMAGFFITAHPGAMIQADQRLRAMGAGVFENSRSCPVPQHGVHRVRRIRIAIGRSAEWRPRAPVTQGPARAALAIDGRLKCRKSRLAPN